MIFSKEFWNVFGGRTKSNDDVTCSQSDYRTLIRVVLIWRWLTRQPIECRLDGRHGCKYKQQGKVNFGFDIQWLLDLNGFSHRFVIWYPTFISRMSRIPTEKDRVCFGHVLNDSSQINSKNAQCLPFLPTAVWFI